LEVLVGTIVARKRGVRLSVVERAELQRLMASGETQERVAELIGCDVRTVIRWIMHDGGLRPYQRGRSALRLSPEERERIVVGIAEGKSAASIARELDRSSSTVSREIARNGGRVGYRAAESDKRALQ
jgi:DNA-binding CsgD family transcriptional regulator